MPKLENVESRKACALIDALAYEQITFGEFADAARSLPNEVLQVTATILGVAAAEASTVSQQMRIARRLCSGLAAASRHLS